MRTDVAVALIAFLRFPSHVSLLLLCPLLNCCAWLLWDHVCWYTITACCLLLGLVSRAAPTYLPWKSCCLALMAVDCLEKHVVLSERPRAVAATTSPSLPFPRTSIRRDSAGARWKPLAMIYGMSSPGEPVAPPLLGSVCLRASSPGS